MSYMPELNEQCLVSSPIAGEFWLVIYKGVVNGQYQVEFDGWIIDCEKKPEFYRLITGM